MYDIDPAPASWIKVVGMLPTPPGTLQSWIIKANPSCLFNYVKRILAILACLVEAMKMTFTLRLPK